MKFKGQNWMFTVWRRDKSMYYYFIYKVGLSLNYFRRFLSSIRDSRNIIFALSTDLIVSCLSLTSHRFLPTDLILVFTKFWQSNTHRESFCFYFWWQYESILHFFSFTKNNINAIKNTFLGNNKVLKQRRTGIFSNVVSRSHTCQSHGESPGNNEGKWKHLKWVS